MNFKTMRSTITAWLCSFRWTMLIFCATVLAARGEEQLSLDDQEHLDVQRDLSALSIGVWILVIGLLIFAYSIRYIARRTTLPCPWCMEFIRKSERVCPRCGKPIRQAAAEAKLS